MTIEKFNQDQKSQNLLKDNDLKINMKSIKS